LKKAGLLLLLFVFAFFSLLASAGCGKKGTEEPNVQSNLPTNSKSSPDNQVNPSISSNANKHESHPSSETTEDLAENTGAGDRASEKGAGKDSIMENLPKDFPFPDDYNLLLDQSAIVSAEGRTQVMVQFLTNEKADSILELYKKYLKDQGDYIVTEIPDPPGIMAYNEEGLLGLSISDSGQQGYTSIVNLNVTSH